MGFNKYPCIDLIFYKKGYRDASKFCAPLPPLRISHYSLRIFLKKVNQ